MRNKANFLMFILAATMMIATFFAISRAEAGDNPGTITMAATSTASSTDLLLQSIVAVPASPVGSENVVVTVTGKNNGSIELYDMTGISNYVRSFTDFSVSTTTLPVVTTTDPLVPGETFAYIFSGHFTSSGTKSLSFILDDGNLLAENDETNNTSSISVIVQPAITTDLKMDNIALSDNSPLVNQNISITVTGKNNGSTSLYNMLGLSNYLRSLADFSVSTTTLPIVTTTDPLVPNEIFSYIFSGYFTSAGSKSLSFTVDHGNLLVESNETNNVVTKTIGVLSATSTPVDDDDDDDKKVYVCHVTGNGKAQTLRIAKSALQAHLDHGDQSGKCDKDDDDDDDDDDRSDRDDRGKWKERYRNLWHKVKGRILLQVQKNGEAWYVKPSTGLRVYLKNGEIAYALMRSDGLGISNRDLAKIPVGIEDRFKCQDSDGDKLCDKLEEGLGLDPKKADTDGDGIDDRTEALSSNNVDQILISRVAGQIVLQVESRGEAWYINPVDGKRYYMKDGDAAYQIMRYLSLGITDGDLANIETE